MGSIYYRSKHKRWRVLFRYRGYPMVSAHFDTEKEAREFHDLLEDEYIAKKKARKLKESLRSIH